MELLFKKMDIVQNELENYAFGLMEKHKLSEEAMIRIISEIQNSMRKCALTRRSYNTEMPSMEIISTKECSTSFAVDSNGTIKEVKEDAEGV